MMGEYSVRGLLGDWAFVCVSFFLCGSIPSNRPVIICVQITKPECLVQCLFTAISAFCIQDIPKLKGLDSGRVLGSILGRCRS